MSLNPMLLNNTLIHHQQQSQQMHPSSMAAAIGTSNSSTPSIYDFGQQAHNNMLQSNMQNFRKDTSKARQIKKEEHLGSRSPTTSPMPKRSNQSASGIISSNGDQKEAETQLMMQQKEPSINGSPKPSMNDTTDQKKEKVPVK
uniref:Uncharacterized protein n=1 Tax=Ditylenchus dipsaci TaxID=166011 RepID=A0A915E0W4_9BILA